MRKFALFVAFLVAFAVSAAPLNVQRWDTNHSTIAFRIPILGGMSEVEGKFTDFTIDVDYDPDDLANSRVVAVIKAASIDTGVDDRDKHLRSPDFFDVEKFPEIRFESSRIVKKGDAYVAQGTFTMHGVSKQIELPFRATGTKKIEERNGIVLGFAAKTRLDRSDYGLKWKHSADPLFVGDDVEIDIRLISRVTPLPKE